MVAVIRAPNTAVRPDKLARADIVFAVTHKTWGDDATADITRQGGKLHAAGRIIGEIAVNSHNAVTLIQKGRDAFKTAARGHGIGHNTVGVDAFDLVAGSFLNKLIHSGPVALLFIKGAALFNGLVGTGWIDLIGGFAVQPVIGTAQARAFGSDDTDM